MALLVVYLWPKEAEAATASMFTWKPPATTGLLRTRRAECCRRTEDEEGSPGKNSCLLPLHEVPSRLA